MRATPCVLLVTLLGMAAIQPAWSQATASLVGTVTDSTGAVLPGTTIALTNEATHATRTTTAESDGGYSLPQLPPGSYTVEFKTQGFRADIHHNVILPVGTQRVLDVTMQVGQVTQEIVVQSAAVPINTTDASIGNPFGQLQVRELPLEARNPSQLLSLQAGVVWAAENLDDERTGSVFGGRSNQGNISLDGADVNDQVNQRAMQSVLPIPLDSVQEFRVTTLAGGAQYGRSSGAQIELITKSGSDHWHGSAYEYNRNELFASNGFFENRLGIPKAPLKRNIFGASLGGPIKKDRAYFFLNWESRRDSTGTPQTRTVPTDSFRDGVLMYQCDDSSKCPGGTVAGLTSNHTIPAGWFGLTPSQIATAIDPCGSTTCIDPFGKTVIPGVNQPALALLQAYPKGNDPSLGSIGGLDNGFNSTGLRFVGPITVTNNDYVARFDVNLDRSGNHTLFWRGTLADDKQINQPQQFLVDPLTGGPGFPVSNGFNNSKGMTASYTAILRPTLINTFRYGFTRQGVDAGGSVGPQWTARGFSDFEDFGVRAKSGIVPTHLFEDDMTWTRGMHTVEFGFDARHISYQRSTSARSYVSYNANNGWMSGLGRNCVLPGISAPTCPNATTVNSLPAVSGGFTQPFARLTTDMLGLFTDIDATYQFDLSGNRIPFGTPQARDFITKEYEGYIQDSLRLKSNFTVKLGLRYSYASVPYEKNGLEVIPDLDLGKWFAQRISNMEKGIPSDASPLINFVPGGSANHASGWFRPDRNNFAPRVSLAYSPGFDSGVGGFLFGGPGKSSIRAGFGVAYDRVSGGLPGVLDDHGGVGLSSNITTPFAFYDYVGDPSVGSRTAGRFTGYGSLPPAGQPFFAPPMGGFPAKAATDSNQYGAAIDPSLHTPYSMQFDLTIDRELRKGIVLEVGYVGRQGRGLLIQSDYSQYLRFRDPVSRMNLWEAFNQLEKFMHSSNFQYNGSCLLAPSDPGFNCPPIPFFENVTSGMAAFWGAAKGTTFPSNTAAMANFAASTNAPGWSDVVKDVDVNIPLGTGNSVYNNAIDPQRDGRVLFPQQYTHFPVWTNNANSSYNGLVIAVRRRVGSFQFDANYVFSKSLDDGSTSGTEQDEYRGVLPNSFPPNRHAYRALSDFDVMHNFNANWLYELPIGRGKGLGSHFPGWADQIVGGWQVSGVWRWRSGFPLCVGNGFWYPTTWDVAGCAQLVAPLKSHLQKNAVDGPNLFENPVNDTIGNPFDGAGTAYADFIHTPMGSSGSRNIIRGGGFFTIDLGLGKSFRLPKEGQRLQFRWEVFNLTNTVSFASGTGVIPNAGFNTGISLDLDSVSSFGRLINTTSSASQTYPLVPHNRVMQIGLRYEF